MEGSFHLCCGLTVPPEPGVILKFTHWENRRSVQTLKFQLRHGPGGSHKVWLVPGNIHPVTRHTQVHMNGITNSVHQPVSANTGIFIWTVFHSPNVWLNIKREHWKKWADEQRSWQLGSAGLSICTVCACMCLCLKFFTHTDDILSVQSECIKMLLFKCIWILIRS